MQRRLGSYFYRSKNTGEENPSKQWSISRMIMGFLRKTSLIIGGTILFIIGVGILSTIVLGGRNTLPDDMILVLNMDDPVSETAHGRTLTDPLASPGMTVRSMVEMLDHAATDKRVRGLLVSLDTGAMELSHIQEIRAAVKRFRASGKFAYIYTASFADLRSGIGAYYFATAFDKIWMQPVGMLSITGLSLEMPFAKETLGKMGVNPEFLHREEYKSAMESFTNNAMSPANREMMQSILDDLSTQIFNDIAMDRQIENAVLRAQLDKGLITGKVALDAKLIDRIGYTDVLLDQVREEITGSKDSDEPPLVIAEEYADIVLDKKAPKQADVALVHVTGQIVPGSEPEPGFAPGDYIASAILDAADDKTIKVIVVRVNSPGGSPSASETIRRSLVYAKEKGKKVVVSMGPTAASGGYWISVDADKIYAMPSTLTGSIGVIMGKFELSGLWDKIGVNWDGVHWGRNATLWSMNAPLSETQRATLNEAIDSTYGDFIERVAEGRKMKPEDVRKIAKGRAWTGTQARANGLVDDLGGLDAALDHAATLVGVENRTKLKLIDMPEPLSPFKQLMKMMGNQVWMGQGLPAVEAIQPYLQQYQAMERSGPVQATSMGVPRIRP